MKQMKHYSYGDLVRGRAKHLLGVLLSYAYDELEGTEQLHSDLKVNWQTEKQLVVRTKLRTLEKLTEKDKTLGKLTKEQIREAINHLKNYLEILVDNRESSRGSEDWHFTLELWSKDKEENLRRFDAEWQAKLPRKSKDFADKALIDGLTSLQTSSQNESPTLILSTQSRYRSHIEEGHIKIQPDHPYLDVARSSGEIGSPDTYSLNTYLSRDLMRFNFPAIDVKLVNNTSQTLFFHEAIFQIKKSRLDPRPLPIVKGEGEMRFALINLGWAPLEDCVLRFTLVRQDRTLNRGMGIVYGGGIVRATAIQYPFELKFGNVKEKYRSMSLTSFFKEAGVDIERLEALRNHRATGSQWVYFDEDSELGEPCLVDGSDLGFKWKGIGKKQKRLLRTEYKAMEKEALGPFAYEKPIILGELEYVQMDSEGNKSRKMIRVMDVVNISRQLEAQLEPSFSYNVRFQVEGENYKKIVPISHALGVGTTDRFLFYVAADKSSLHNFDLVLRYNDSEQIQSKPIELELFLPRGSVPNNKLINPGFFLT